MTYALIPLYFSFLKKKEQLLSTPYAAQDKQSIKARVLWINLAKYLKCNFAHQNYLKFWHVKFCAKMIYESLIVSHQLWMDNYCWNRVEEAEENWTSCWLQSHHLCMWLWAVAVLFKPLAYATFLLFFKVLLCQCSCYVAEDQQFQWLEKVKLARQQIE